MKIKILLCIALSCFVYLSSSQVPKGINYQALARDATGKPISKTTIQVKLALLSDTVSNTIVWEELFNPVTTNAYGLFGLVIGSGVRQSTSTVQSFSDIDWDSTALFIKTQIYYQNAWKVMGASKLWSVPYSLSTGGISGPLKKLSVNGQTANTDEALFEVKNISGQTVFAVYNEGVRVYVDDGISKGTKGGFAIGGFNTTKADPQNLFVVTADSIRAYIGTNPVKGTKGGFAIGGFNTSKSPNEEYLRVTRDSTRVTVNQTSKGTKGGFAIGGFNDSKGSVNNFLNLTPQNYFIGHESGKNNTTGLYNSFLGFQAGRSNTLGNSNIFIGYQSGYSNTLGDDNTFVGYQSGYSNVGNNIGGVWQHGKWNCFFGYQAGYANFMGDFNTFIGYQAGKNNQSSLNTFVGYQAGVVNNMGTYNTFMGVTAGYANVTGSNNTFIGHQAGYCNVDGENNLFIGDMAGAAIRSGNDNVVLGLGAVSGSVYGMDGTGSSNVIIGIRAGQYTRYGSANIMLGYQAGYYESGSNRLYIENSSNDKDNALIYGEFDNDYLKLNATVKIRDVLKITPRATAPSSPEEGDVYYSSVSHKLLVWNGTAWMACF